jgi:hypothetical protein
MDNSIIAKVVEQMETLPSDMQRLVLEFARTLHSTTPHGISGRHYLQFANVIPRDDLRQMQHAIVAGCAQVAVNEW